MTDVESLQRSFAHGLVHGEQAGFTRIGSRTGAFDVSRGCETPIAFTRWSRSTSKIANITKDGIKTVPMIQIHYLAPCRRCRVCLWKHSRHWAYRAITELETADRNWFGTLTVNPDNHIWVDHVCSTRKRDFWELPTGKKFAEQAKVIGMEVTKYLKRIRKDADCRFRYLCVFETHDGIETSDFMRGRAHVHLLLHEFPGQPLRKSLLERQWKMGHTHYRLVQNKRKAAWYVSKYISKASDARVRASQAYGSQMPEIENEGHQQNDLWS